MKLRYLIILLLPGACQKDQLGPQFVECSGDCDVSTSSVLILNEGNFGWGNASLSAYQISSRSVESNVFQAINGFALGDVAQSISSVGKYIAIVVNNSGKIEFLDTSSLEVEHTIIGLNSPRQIVRHNNKLYVSDLYANQISVFNINNFTNITNISVNGWTEHLTIVGDQILASMPDLGQIKVISSSSDQVVQTIHLTKGVGRVVNDINGMIWALCNGGDNEKIPKLYKIDPVSFSLEDSLSFQLSESPGMLCTDQTGQCLYFVNYNLFRFEVSANQLPTNPVFICSNKNVYTIAVDPNNGDIYISDAKDYVQKSEVTRLNSAFQVIDSFNSGIISGSFLFR